ncbi:MAG: alcohol dehydrogenase catalytic domain-containing protein [Armatimonadota bacterium]|nr:alcohol dehydrogenase catalytic domain-containing protein [Armatimonadota bacterium]
MKAARLYAPGDIRFEETPTPQPQPGEAIVRIRSVGVCASDLHFYRNGEIGGQGFTEPALLGHECAGEIAALGDPAGAHERTGSWKVGDRVAMEPTRPCGVCDLCCTGHYNICRKLRFAGQPPEAGGFCEYLVVPLERLFHLPDALSFEEGAMVEPVAVAVHAVKLAGVQSGSSVAVLGGGAIGLSILQVAAAYGAGPLFLSEPLPFRRGLAGRVGATTVIDPTAEDPEEVIRAGTGGAGVDVAFEASGSAEAPAQCCTWVGSGGTLCLVGIPDEDELVLPASVIRRREMTIRTVRRYCNDFEEALRLIAFGAVNAKLFTTHHFSLADTDKAFAAAVTQPDEVLRAIVEVP